MGSLWWVNKKREEHQSRHVRGIKRKENMVITSPLPQKKDGSVVTHEIPNALVGVEFDGKTARISGGVG
jgi:hypothetical protein